MLGVRDCKIFTAYLTGWSQVIIIFAKLAAFPTS